MSWHTFIDDRKLLDGDILNVDITTIINGWHGDTSRMYKVGKVSVKALNFVRYPSLS
jgi:methionyl aminopeptidase